MTPLREHPCPMCRCGAPRCPDCGYVLPLHDESAIHDMTQWCPRSPTRRAVIADEKQRGVHDPKDWQ